MQRCRWTNEEYVMIQSVRDRTNTASKHVMISTWLRIWWEEQKPTLRFVKDPDHTAALVSNKCTDDPSAAAGKEALWIRDQVYILKNCCPTRNPHNKYWSAASVNWQSHEWCGCRRAGWMDGMDQPDEVRQQSSGCIWPSPSPVKWGTDITQYSRPCEPPLDHQPRHVTHTLSAFTTSQGGVGGWTCR